MFHTVKDENGKIVARLRSKEQCEAFVSRVGGDKAISENADYAPPRGRNSHNEWCAY